MCYHCRISVIVQKKFTYDYDYELQFEDGARGVSLTSRPSLQTDS